MARAPVSKTGGWGFESLHSCQVGKNSPDISIHATKRAASHPYGRRSNSGSLVMSAAIWRASSRVSSFAAARRRGSSSKYT